MLWSCQFGGRRFLYLCGIVPPLPLFYSATPLLFRHRDPGHYTRIGHTSLPVELEYWNSSLTIHYYSQP